MVVLDRTMPGMSGEEVLPRIQAVDPDVQMILSTGYSEEDSLSRMGRTQLGGGSAEAVYD